MPKLLCRFAMSLLVVLSSVDYAQASWVVMPCDRELKADAEIARMRELLDTSMTVRSFVDELRNSGESVRWFSENELNYAGQLSLDPEFVRDGGLIGKVVAGYSAQTTARPQELFVGRVVSAEPGSGDSIEFTLDDQSSRRIRPSNLEELWVLGNAVSDQDMMRTILNKQNLRDRVIAILGDLQADDFELLKSVFEQIYRGVPVARLANPKPSARHSPIVVSSLGSFVENILKRTVPAELGSESAYRYSPTPWKKALELLAGKRSVRASPRQAASNKPTPVKEGQARGRLAELQILERFQKASQLLLNTNVLSYSPLASETHKLRKVLIHSVLTEARYDSRKAQWNSAYQLRNSRGTRMCEVGDGKSHLVHIDFEISVTQSRDGDVLSVNASWILSGAVVPTDPEKRTSKPLWHVEIIPAPYIVSTDPFRDEDLDELIQTALTLGRERVDRALEKR